MTINLRRYRLVRNAVVVWMTVVIAGAFLLEIPRINILEHTARNLMFHLPMWGAMFAAGIVAVYHSVGVLRTGDLARDVRAEEAVRLAVVFGVLGLVTGMVWARYTWYVGAGKWWNWDPKQSMALVQVMIYGGYFVLRSALDEPRLRARIAAVYNLFALAVLPFLLYVLPRQMESLHPGADGNPAFSDITHPSIRFVLYPAIVGFIGVFWVLYTQRVRVRFLRERLTPEPEL